MNLEEKVIGFKVPLDSDIPERLKTLGWKLRLKQKEVLVEMVKALEAKVEGLESGQIKLFPDDSEKVNQDNDLKKRVDELEQKILELAQEAPRPQKNINKTPDEKPVLRPFEKMILKLKGEGFSTRDIGKMLESEGYKTPTGLTNWHHDTINKVIKKYSVSDPA